MGLATRARAIAPDCLQGPLPQALEPVVPGHEYARDLRAERLRSEYQGISAPQLRARAILGKLVL